MEKKLQIRNSTAEFLIFTSQSKQDGIEVRFQNDTVWLTQRYMALLFDTTSDNIGLHLKNIYSDNELNEAATTEDFSVVRKEGNIYATAMDYNPDSPTTKEFFAKVQNKMHYAIHNQTAAELIFSRADHSKENMGLTHWEKSPNGKILKTDVLVAKNYLKQSELESLGRIVNGYLDFAEEYAKRQTPLTMEDWAKHLDLILQANGKELLQNAGKITAELAKQHAENEFVKYRPIQDKLFKTDFDKSIKLEINNCNE